MEPSPCSKESQWQEEAERKAFSTLVGKSGHSEPSCLHTRNRTSAASSLLRQTFCTKPATLATLRALGWEQHCGPPPPTPPWPCHPTSPAHGQLTGLRCPWRAVWQPPGMSRTQAHAHEPAVHLQRSFISFIDMLGFAWRASCKSFRRRFASSWLLRLHTRCLRSLAAAANRFCNHIIFTPLVFFSASFKHKNANNASKAKSPDKIPRMSR